MIDFSDLIHELKNSETSEQVLQNSIQKRALQIKANIDFEHNRFNSYVEKLKEKEDINALIKALTKMPEYVFGNKKFMIMCLKDELE